MSDDVAGGLDKLLEKRGRYSHCVLLKKVGHYVDVALTSRHPINAAVDQEYYRFAAVWRIAA
jgi:hypothetical protein